MFEIRTWKTPCSQIAIVVSILALALIINFVPFYPRTFSFSFSRASSPQNSSVRTGSSEESATADAAKSRGAPMDLATPWVYRGAPWKVEIGRWLNACDSMAVHVDVKEEVHGIACKNGCSRRGVCNHELGGCRCFHGYSGDDCSLTLNLSCNYPSSPGEPFGQWVVSICSARCDTTRAMCLCGDGTKYPSRPVAEACGFQTKPEGTTDWTKSDSENIMTTNKSKRGWCNVDPEDGARFKPECHCKYDCLAGRFCEVPVSCVCVNQCTGRGSCRGGSCECDDGWYGIDCSIPSSLLAANESPKKKKKKKKRPLIYVYDLPPEFNSGLMEGRHYKMECVNRIYSETNETVWFDQLYGAQMAFYESLLASYHRTTNGDEADFFFVPVLDSCIVSRAGDAPHMSMGDHRGLRSSFALDYYKKAYGHIMETYSYWNVSSGRDHLWFFSWDEGACCAPKEIWNSTMLVHWGNTNSRHGHSTTAYWADNWDDISPDRRGSHPCFDPTKDLVLPAWKAPVPQSLKARLWSRGRGERKTLFYFNGNLGPAFENGRPEASYSMGIRQKVAEEFGSVPDRQGKLGRQHAADVVVTPVRSERYAEELSGSVFCGVFPGDGWSGRMEDSVLHGCIPVLVQDGVMLPFENVLDYDAFTVRISEDDIPAMMDVLRRCNETRIEALLSGVRQVWGRFMYTDSMLLEAMRQEGVHGHVADWASELRLLTGDDAFATFVQVLHYKLHNDSWRRQHGRRSLRAAADYGLPQHCLSSS